ncbi:MAG: hypothetical protein H7210_02390 [Pyrinomonadaceae bacterium]|nr:hypothetical protein [Phycisphaerales bacterium]
MARDVRKRRVLLVFAPYQFEKRTLSPYLPRQLCPYRMRRMTFCVTNQVMCSINRKSPDPMYMIRSNCQYHELNAA